MRLLGFILDRLGARFEKSKFLGIVASGKEKQTKQIIIFQDDVSTEKGRLNKLQKAKHHVRMTPCRFFLNKGGGN